MRPSSENCFSTGDEYRTRFFVLSCPVLLPTFVVAGGRTGHQDRLFCAQLWYIVTSVLIAIRTQETVKVLYIHWKRFVVVTAIAKPDGQTAILTEGLHKE